TSRRDKLRRIAELGRDPWGSRFDDHAAIAAIRGRAGEVVYRLQDGREAALPDIETAGPEFDFRKWLAEQGPGEMVGPRVRAAGEASWPHRSGASPAAALFGFNVRRRRDAAVFEPHENHPLDPRDS